VGGEGDGEYISDFTVEVGEATLRSAEHTDFELGKLLKAVSEQPTDDGFSRARVSCDQGEAALAHEVLSLKANESTPGDTNKASGGTSARKGFHLSP